MNFQANVDRIVGSKLNPQQKVNLILQTASKHGRPIDQNQKSEMKWLNAHANAKMIGNMRIGEVISLAQRGARLRNRLIQFGLTPAAAAALAANAMVESKGYYRSPQLSGGPGYGLWQWSRERQDLFRQKFQRDMSNSSEDDQIKFMLWEMTNQHPYHDAWTALHSNQSPGQMADSVARIYERMANKQGDPEKRAAIAELLNAIPVDPRMNLSPPLSAPPEIQYYFRQKARRQGNGH